MSFTKQDQSWTAQENDESMKKELPPMKRQNSQDPTRNKRKSRVVSLREGESMLAQAGRLQLASSKINQIQPLKTSSKKRLLNESAINAIEPERKQSNNIGPSVGSALNACRAQSSRRVKKANNEDIIQAESPLHTSLKEPKVEQKESQAIKITQVRGREKECKKQEKEGEEQIKVDDNSNAVTRSDTSTPTSVPQTSQSSNNPLTSKPVPGAVKLEPIKEKPPQPKIDFEKRYMEHLKAISEKKKLENQMIEQQRRKMKDTREKLKKMILNRVERRKKQKEETEAIDINISQESKEEQKEIVNRTPVKRVSKFQVMASPPKREQLAELGINIKTNEKTQEEKEQQERQKKLELQKLQKYYRSRYATMLQMIKDNLKSKKEKEQREQEQEQKKREMLKQQIGVASVQSRFMKLESQQKKEETRYQSMPPPSIQTRQSRTFYKPKERNEKSDSPQQKEEQVSNNRAKDDADLPTIKETAKRQTQDKMLRKHQQFLQELQRKKMKQKKQKLEEQKRKERIRNNLREMVKIQNEEQLQKRQKTKQELEEDEQDKRAKKEEEERKKELRDPRKIAQANQNFLERNMVIKRPINKIMITDMAQWKKRNRVKDSQRVFFASGGYSELKKALKERNWVENKDLDSPCFDLKWTLKAKDIIHDQLQPHQLVNHFDKNTAVTTKVGLCHNLKNLIWFENVDIDEFYPRCFDLIEGGELEDFIEEFKVVKAESILKLFYIQRRVDLASRSKADRKLAEVDENKVVVALSICERRLMDLDELIDDPSAEHVTLITAAEWEILSTDDKTAYESGKQSSLILALSKHERFLTRVNAKYGRKFIGKKKRKGKDQILANETQFVGEAPKQEEEIQDYLVKKVREVLEGMKKKFPQFMLNGYRNMWMLKPAGLSRGRGIQVFNSLNQIMGYTRHKEQQWVIQKYIENPLIIHDRKFDIRQWVLVTDWNPLTIWFYNECYIRFSAKKYDPNILGNKFIHLCNNSINKHSKGKDYDHDQQIGEGLMWDNQEFQEWLEGKFGYDIWAEQLQPQLKDIVIHSLKSVQDMVENRKNSFEMFGYDFMVDEDGVPWLIEINSSPAMDYSTQITERMVKQGLRDIVKVVVDYHFASHKRRAHVDTGQFELIHRSKRQVERPMNSFGLNLVVEGKRMKY